MNLLYLPDENHQKVSDKFSTFSNVRQVTLANDKLLRVENDRELFSSTSSNYEDMSSNSNSRAKIVS